MMRRFILAVVLMIVAAPGAEANLMDTWQEVQERLAIGDAEAAEQSIGILRERAAELEAWRLPAFAAALVAWAESNPGESGEAMLRAAKELDPEYPTSYFLQARWNWRDGAKFGAVREFLAGWVALIRFEPTRRTVKAWLVQWSMASLVLAFFSMILAVTLRYLRGLMQDARDLGGSLFRPANAWVFAVVVLLLPVFGGLGPIWLTVYLFVLSWIYLSPALRIWAVTACVLLALTGPVLSWVQGRMLRGSSVMERVAITLEERQVDFSTLREFAELESVFSEKVSYHLILGELLRMHGEPGRAKLQFQKAAVADPGAARPLIFVGNLILEEGDAQRAVQLFNSALDKGQENAFAHHNLSLAFDLNRKFQEGDSHRAKAKEYVGRQSAEAGLRGLDPRIRYPRLGESDVETLLGDLEDEELALVGETDASLSLMTHLLAPLSMVFLVGGAIGVILLVIRLRFFPPARECTKCGKGYRLQAGFGESSVYCSQCVSVFQKRDVVSIEQQTAKLRQIKRWDRLTILSRRLGGLLFPGSPYYLCDRVIRGVIFSFAAWFFLSGALFWGPEFVPLIEPLAFVEQIRVILLALFGLLAIRSALMSWDGR